MRPTSTSLSSFSRSRDLSVALARVALAMSVAAISACSPPAAPPLDAASLDAGAFDAGALDAGALDARRDAGECLTVEVGTWYLDNADDVSVRYRARVSPDVGGQPWDLFLDFYRYGDATYVGSFPLGTGPDANFGTCAHCVIAFYGATMNRGFMAERGTLELRADPFELRLDATLDGARLREVTIEGDDLHSVPVPGGRCLDLVRTTIDARFAPSGWTCPAADYDDGAECHCACGIVDPDCFGTERPVVGCGAGQVCVARPAPSGLVMLVPGCAHTCDRATSAPCPAAGVCVDDPLGEVCEPVPALVDRAASLGATCASGARWCAVDAAGFAQGMCDDAEARCRPRCEADADCDVVAYEHCYTNGVRDDGSLYGYCAPRFPPEWTCGGGQYEDGVSCDCACGAPDPDCADVALPVVGCGAMEACLQDGVCAPIPANDTCATAVTLMPGTTAGTTLAASDDHTFVRGAGGCIDVEEDGPDVVYSVALAAGQRLVVRGTPTDYDLALYLLGPGDAAICDRTSTACVAGAEAAGFGEAESLDVTATVAGTYYLVVDSFFSGFSGPFALDVTTTP